MLRRTILTPGSAAGKQDKWVPCKRAEKLKNLIGGKSEVVLVEDAGHLIQLDQPERLMAEIAMFLAEVDAIP